MRRILRALLLILCLPLILLLVVLIAPVLFVLIVCVLVSDWWKRRKFLKRNRGVFFLVLTRRHDWEPFLKNNLLPSLKDIETETIQLIQIHWSDRHDRNSKTRDHYFPTGINKPYLIRFHADGHQLESLHDELLKFKEERQLSPEVTQTVRKLLVEKISKLERAMPID